MKLTKLVVDKLALPTVGNQKRYYDEMMRGLGVRITIGGVKSFFVERMIAGKQKRITLGRYPRVMKRKKYSVKLPLALIQLPSKKLQSKKRSV